MLLLAGGAAGVYLANILARRSFSEAQFVEWAYATSLTAFFFSFSLLGSEQLIVRAAYENGARLAVPKRAAILIAGSFVAFLLGYALVLDGRLFAYRMGVASVPVLVSIGVIQVVYQCERARGQLLAAQVVFNAWKYALPLLVLLGPPVRGAAEFAVSSALISGLLVTCVVARRASSSLALGDQARDVGRVYLPFMLSLGTMAMLGMADRYVLEKIYRPEEFAAYVYLVTLVTTPFNFLSGYFGFQEAVRYRNSYSRRAVRRDAFRKMGSTSVLVVAWSATCFAARGFLSLPFDVWLWALLGALSVIRCGYAVLSAAMGVRGSPRAIYFANGTCVLAVAAFAGLAVTVSASLLSVVGGYVAVWLIRWIVYFLLLPSPETYRTSPSCESQ